MSLFSDVHSDERPGGLVEGLDRQQRAAHVRVDDDRVGGLVGVLRAGQRAALEPVLGVGGGVLVGDLRLGEALHADREPRLVHHHEHRVEAAIRLADEPAGRAVVVHHAGGVAVDAHLVLDRPAGDAVPFAQRPVRVDQHLRHHEERDALGAGGRPLDAGEHQVDDVLGEVVLARRDEDLGAGDRVGAVGVRHRLRLEEAEIRAAMRLGQVHGAGPGALDHLRQVGPLLLLGAVHHEGRDRALRQARIHAEREVRGRDEFLHHGVEGARQALAAILGRGREAHPAALRIGPVGLPEARRGGHAAVGMAGAALLVADPVQGREHLLAQPGALGDDRLDHVRGGVREAREVVVALEVEDVVEEKQDVLDGGLVGGHAGPSRYG